MTAAGSGSPPDIVLVMTDQQRFDQIGYASAGVVRTPNLDRLAASGVTFQSAYSASTDELSAEVDRQLAAGPPDLPDLATDARGVRPDH